jgi:outer membrane biosynthesis protein TonB
MQRNWSYFGLLLLTSGLVTWSTASYSSNGGNAYWQNKRWYRMLLESVQSTLHYPTDAAGQPLQPVPELAQVTVSFIYANGKISDPKIIKSSGRSDLDAAFLSQLATVQPPKASSSHAAEPHLFKLALKMRTPMQDFEDSICKAINAKWELPRDLILAGALGSTIIEFMYFKGKVSDIKVVVSSGSTLMDKSFMQAMREAHMPMPPVWLPIHPLHMKATLIYVFGDPGMCSWSKVRLRAPDTSQTR